MVADGPFAAAGLGLYVSEDDVCGQTDIFKLVVDVGQEIVFHGTAVPVRENFFLQYLLVLIGDDIRILRSCGHGVHLGLYPVEADVRADYCGSVLLAVGADDQLVVAYTNLMQLQ